jgi:uncharacterized protein YndB with AHSA1/START domain
MKRDTHRFWSGVLDALKRAVERSAWSQNGVETHRKGDDQMPKQLEYTYDIYIGAPIGKVWNGLVDGDMTKHYVYGTRLETKLKKGSPYAYVGDGNFKVVDGEILDVEPEKRLVMTWRAHWDEKVAKDPASRVSYELVAAGASTTKLRVVHDGFDGATATYTGSAEGWPLMLSSLKSLLETGRPLATG